MMLNVKSSEIKGEGPSIFRTSILKATNIVTATVPAECRSLWRRSQPKWNKGYVTWHQKEDQNYDLRNFKPQKIVNS